MVWRTDDEPTSSTHWYMKNSTVIGDLCCAIDGGRSRTSRSNEIEWVWFHKVLYLKTFLSKVNKESLNEIWYLSYMIMKHKGSVKCTVEPEVEKIYVYTAYSDQNSQSMV